MFKTLLVLHLIGLALGLGVLVLAGVGHRLALGFGRGRRCGRGHRFELVLAHVVVHLAPAGEHGGLVGALVQAVTLLHRACRVAAAAADGLALGLALGRDGGGRLDAQLVAAGQPQRGGSEQGKGEAAHGG